MYAKRGTGTEEMACKTCGKRFIVWAYEVRNGRKFCSQKCKRYSKEAKERMSKGRMGKGKHSEARKKMMSKFMTGNDWGFQVGKPSVFKGKKRPNLRGKNHWNWKGGSSPEAKLFKSKVEYRLWREAVFARDNWTCQKCDKRDGSELNPHHIRNFAECLELRTSIENGITFCRDCHMEFHRIHGRKGNNLKQLEEFLR